jgi:hypothetical protein
MKEANTTKTIASVQNEKKTAKINEKNAKGLFGSSRLELKFQIGDLKLALNFNSPHIRALDLKTQK